MRATEQADSQSLGVTARTQFFDRLNRRLGMMRSHVATSVLLGGSLCLAEAIATIASLVVEPIEPDLFITGAMVALLLAAPFILYTSFLMRRLHAVEHDAHSLREQIDMSADYQASTARARFLAKISHELRTPLNAIIGFSSILRNETPRPLSAECHIEYADHIHKSGMYLLAAVENMLELARIQACKLGSEWSANCDLNVIVMNVLEQLIPPADRQNIDVKCSLPKSPLKVVGVERLLHKAVFALVSNALKFTSGYRRIRISGRRCVNGDAVIVVADNGIGMSASDITAALQPFGLIEEPRRVSAGMGLSLPLAQAIVDAHRGTLAIKSKRGSSTAVVLTFPGLSQSGLEPAVAVRAT
jgi:signal transduction histidine kinase